MERKTFLTLLLVLMIAACSLRNFTGVKAVPVTNDVAFLPRRAYVRGLPTGDDSYSVGFRAGCQTAFGVVGAGAMRLIPEKIDPDKLVNDPMYLRGWHDGIGHCNDRLDWEGH